MDASLAVRWSALRCPFGDSPFGRCRGADRCTCDMSRTSHCAFRTTRSCMRIAGVVSRLYLVPQRSQGCAGAASLVSQYFSNALSEPLGSGGRVESAHSAPEAVLYHNTTQAHVAHRAKSCHGWRTQSRMYSCPDLYSCPYLRSNSVDSSRADRYEPPTGRPGRRERRQ